MAPGQAERCAQPEHCADLERDTGAQAEGRGTLRDPKPRRTPTGPSGSVKQSGASAHRRMAWFYAKEGLRSEVGAP